MALPAEKNTFTFADYLTWNEDEHIELIDGKAVMMAPPSTAHQLISMELSRQLANFLEGKKCRAIPAPFAVRLFEGANDTPADVRTVVEPDISVICDPSKLDDIGCKGAPDFIIEVLSPSTQRHDRVTKFNLYLSAGVREYWIVDPVRKDAQSFVLEDGRYAAKEFGTSADQMKVSVLEDCILDLAQVFGE